MPDIMDDLSDFSGRLAQQLADFPPLSTEISQMALSCILDWCGVTIAGTDEPVSKAVASAYATGGAFLVPGGLAAGSADFAALVAGTTSHALDFDDVHNDIGHPGGPIIAAALAVAQEQVTDGQTLLAALHAGYEAAAAVGSFAMPSHYDRGFHSTGTLGTIGAAVAAARVMRLEPAEVATAIRLAVTQAAGLKAMFGSMAKPFHAGKAASNGVMAARLARAGVGAAKFAIEGQNGFFATQCDLDMAQPLTLDVSGTAILQTRFKRHAACFLTHSSIAAIKDLRADHSITHEDVESVDIIVAPGHLSVCCIPEPRTGLEVKFSLAHIAALALAGYPTASIGTYTQEIARHPDLLRLRQKVRISGTGPLGNLARITVNTRQGTRFTAEADIDRPYASLDEQTKVLEEKFRALVRPVIGAEKTEYLLDRIHGIPALHDVAAITVDLYAGGNEA